VKKYNTRAIVLKSNNYRDTDRFYTLLTKDAGKHTVLARGVRKISSRRSGNLDTLNLIDVKITENTKGFKNVDEVKTIHSFPNLKSKYELVIKAYYLVELVHRSLEEGYEDTEVFDLLHTSLAAIDLESHPVNAVIKRFEVMFLKQLGYELNNGDISDRAVKAQIYEYLTNKLKSLEM